VSGFSYSSLIPPNLFILLAMIGVVIAWRRKPFWLAVATVAMGCLYLVAMPVTAGLLIRSAEAPAAFEPRLPSDTPPGAIVVLSADARRSGILGVPDTVGPLALDRRADEQSFARGFSRSSAIARGAIEEHL
jgi:uncharacterized SAM-binding protein YcdF (DUF218 family)